DVGALRRQDRRRQQLECSAMMQRTGDVRIVPRQGADDPPCLQPGIGARSVRAGHGTGAPPWVVGRVVERNGLDWNRAKSAVIVTPRGGLSTRLDLAGERRESTIRTSPRR